MYLSIVLPCYNEEKQIIQSLTHIVSYMQQKCINYEIIVVDDGSTDRTSIQVNNIIQKGLYSEIKLVTYVKNKGKGYAVKRGIEVAKGKFILFMDADLSTDLRAIDEYLRACKNFDIVIGSRRHKDAQLIKPQGVLRQFIGNSCVKITKLITGMNYQDTQCGFKGFKRDVAKDLAKYQTIETWAFDVEYLYIAKQRGYSVQEIPVIWTNDTDSKVSPIKSSIDFFGNLVIIILNKTKYKG